MFQRTVSDFYFVITFKIHRADAKTISGQTPSVCQGSIVAMSTTAARSDPVFMKDDPCKMFVHPGHQDAQDSIRMREAKTCGCSAGILREKRRAKDEPLMFSTSYCSSSSLVLRFQSSWPWVRHYFLCAATQRSAELGLDLDPLRPGLRGGGAAKDQDLQGASPGGTEDQMFRV